MKNNNRNHAKNTRQRCEDRKQQKKRQWAFRAWQRRWVDSMCLFIACVWLMWPSERTTLSTRFAACEKKRTAGVGLSWGTLDCSRSILDKNRSTINGLEHRWWLLPAAQFIWHKFGVFSCLLSKQVLWPPTGSQMNSHCDGNSQFQQAADWIANCAQQSHTSCRWWCGCLLRCQQRGHWPATPPLDWGAQNKIIWSTLRAFQGDCVLAGFDKTWTFLFHLIHETFWFRRNFKSWVLHKTSCKKQKASAQNFNWGLSNDTKDCVDKNHDFQDMFALTSNQIDMLPQRKQRMHHHCGPSDSAFVGITG